MTTEKLVQQIDGLYPTDCQYEDTNKIGKLLLQKAIENVKYNWRDLPKEVLQEYHRLCVDEENNGELTHELREKGELTGA